MQIIVSDIGSLSAEEREHISGFLLTYPGAGQIAYRTSESVQSNSPELSQVNNPAGAFSAPPPSIPSGPVSSIGPHLVIPNPPPPANVVTAPVPATIPNSAGSANIASLDSAGLPWDARIHSSGKALNADGSWRLKRGVSEVTLAQVTSDLKRLMAIPSPAAAVPTPPSSPVSIPPSPPPAPVLVAPPPPAPIAIDPALQTQFVELFGRTSAALANGKLSQDQLHKCLQAAGLTGLPELGIRLDLLASVAGMIDGIIAGQTA